MKPPSSRVQAMEPLTVALRVRPLSNSECKAGAYRIAHPVNSSLVVLMDPNEDSDDVLRANRSRERKFTFDNAFGPLSSQIDVYRSTVTDGDVIGRILSGYNCTVFAYGATGAGKTYTMLGTSCEQGIMVLTLNDLFQKLENTKEDSYYRVTMAYLEIYNEVVRDLLCPSSGLLELRESADGAVVISGLLEVETSSTSEVMKLLHKGNTQRTSEPTAVNETSSRSHAVLKVTVEQRSRLLDVRQKVRTGVLFMVDLAGSERAAITQNRGKRMIEGAHINRSLLALANCINALACNATSYVNYRDSKLTRLLKDALGGNCKTVMIAHISPASTCFEESRNTLVYAERGKRIKNKLQQNVNSVSYHVTQYTWIIRELNSKLARLQSNGVVCPEVELLCQQLKTLSKQEREFRQELLSVECQLLQNALESQKQSTCIKLCEEGREEEEKEAVASPDSGTVLSPLEPAGVAASREELASLARGKLQLEALHCQLQKQLRDNKRENTKLQEKLSSCGELSGVRRELLQLQQQVSEVDAASVEHQLSAVLLSMQLAHRETTLQSLLELSSQLLALLKQCSEKSDAEAPLCREYLQLASSHRQITSQLTADKPDLSTHLQLPAISRLSAKLYSSMTGSKSNLFAEERLSDSISEIRLVPGPTASPTPANLKQMSTLSLPPIDSKPVEDQIPQSKELSHSFLLPSSSRSPQASSPPRPQQQQQQQQQRSGLFSRVPSGLPVLPGKSRRKYHVLDTSTKQLTGRRGCTERRAAPAHKRRGRNIVTVEELSALAARGPISMARRISERNNTSTAATTALVKRTTAAPKKKKALRQEVRPAKVTTGSFVSPYLLPVRHSGRRRINAKKHF